MAVEHDNGLPYNEIAPPLSLCDATTFILILFRPPVYILGVFFLLSFFLRLGQLKNGAFFLSNR